MHWMSNKLLFIRNQFAKYGTPWPHKHHKAAIVLELEPNLIIIIILWCYKHHTVERVDVNLGSYLRSRGREAVSALHHVTFT